MNRLGFGIFAVSLAFAAIVVDVNAARADSVLVLSAESYDGDVELASNLTGALRHASAQVTGWTLSDREVSLGQMMLVHGCEYANQECLGRIAEALEVDLLVYAEIRQIAGRSRVDVGLYGREAGTIMNVVQDNLAPETTDIDDLRGPAQRYVREIAGSATSTSGETGTVVIYSNADGADVLVNGSSMGTISGDSVTLELPEGEHHITVGGGDYSLESESVTVEAGGRSELTLDVDELGEDSESLYPTMGVVLLGTGAVATAVWVASWVVLSSSGPLSGGIDLSTNDDAKPFIDFLESQPGEAQRMANGNDYCQAADPARNGMYAALGGPQTRNAETAFAGCQRQDTWNPVFAISLTAAILSFAGSAVFFVLDSMDEDSPNLALFPNIGLESAGLDAVLSF